MERQVARCVADRSARVLTQAADAALAASNASDAGSVLGRLADTLLQQAAIQDLLALDEGRPVCIADRMGALAVGILHATPRLAELTTSIPQVRVDARAARWLATVSAEVVESFAAEEGGGEGVRVALVMSLERGRLVVVAAGGSAAAGPSLHLDRARLLAVAMGGRFRERMGDGVRAVRIVLPCAFMSVEHQA